MGATMLLDDLVGTIETLKERIATHGSTLRQNETRTRAALIDPLLTALGWDTADPALVRAEYRVDVGWADYALLGVGTQPAAVIEAKRLGSVVENHLEQTVGYCIQQGIAYARVTDGSHWQVYRTFEPVPLAEKLVLDVSISDAPAHEAALKLLLLWRPNLASGHPVAANAPVFSPPLSESPAGPDSPEPVQDSPADKGSWVSLAKVEIGKGQKRPTAVRFSSGEMRPINTWPQVVKEVAEELVKSGTLTAAHCPITGLDFINSSPVSPSGKNFSNPKAVSGGLYVNAYMNSKRTVVSSRQLLAHFNVNPQSVELLFK